MARPPDPTAKIQLLRAAEEIFARKGLAATKVEEIAREAGLSKGAFYLHFTSKEESFKQVVESFLARCGAHFDRPSATHAPTEPRAMLDYWLERDQEMYAFLWQNRAILRMLRDCQNELGYLLEAFREGIRGTAREWLRHGKKHGLYRRDVDDDVTSTLVCGAYHELTARMLASPARPPFEEWLRTAQRTFARALGTPALLAALDSQGGYVRPITSTQSRGAPARRARAL
jgi:AcrR family transcriptional regulator